MAGVSPARGWRILADVLVVVYAATEVVVWLAGADSPGRLGNVPLLASAVGLIGPLVTWHYGWRVIADAALGWRAFPGDVLAFAVPALLASVVATDSGMWLFAVWLFAALPVLVALLVLISRAASGAPAAAATPEAGADR